MNRIVISGLFLALTAFSVNAKPLIAEAVETAKFKPVDGKSRNPALIKAQILLSRMRFSPGVIDGLGGSNTEKAIAEFERRFGLDADGKLDEAVFDKLTDAAGDGAVLKEVEISKDDADGPFAESIPEKLEDKAALKRLSYKDIRELLGEKYQSKPDLIEALNSGKSFEAGEKITVPAVDSPDAKNRGERIEADKTLGVVRVYDKDDALLAFYPATIGSDDTPSPEGELKVTRIARMPGYTYDPKKLDFKGVEATEKFEIAPGPNNPVGTIWIDLDKEGYGIHGTDEPGEVSKTFSHGCVRLTNWDAEDLAAMIRKGVTVTFTGETPSVVANR